MVPPSAIKVQEGWGEALPAEAKAPNQRKGALVPRLNIGFQAVQPQSMKGPGAEGRKAFSHQSSSAAQSRCVVAQGGAKEAAPDDIVEVHHAEEGAFLPIDQ